MPLSSLSIKATPTSYTVTGGTAIAVGVQTDYDSALVYASADADFRTRRELKITYRSVKPQKSAPNGYTQQRVNGSLNIPQILANTKITKNGGDFSLHFDVEATDAHKIAVMDWYAQLFLDQNFRNTVLRGSPTA